jgi:hypothetical protein
VLRELERHTSGFATAVLAGRDAAGQPVSMRCTPRLVPPSMDIRLDGLADSSTASLGLQPGAACLLWHRHDEEAWHLKSFLVLGQLGHDEHGWFLSPQRFVPGVGIGGPLALARSILRSRRRAAAYLATRRQPWPRIPWQEISDLQRRARGIRRSRTAAEGTAAVVGGSRTENRPATAG